MRAVPDDVLFEIMLNLTLFSLLLADLIRSWMSILPATDASASYGFGFCAAKCDPLVVRQAATVSGVTEHVIRLQPHPGDPVEKW